MENHGLDRKVLRRFGLGLAVILGLIAGLLLWRGRSWWWIAGALSGATLLPALIRPTGLAPVHRFFLWLGEKLAWFNTRLILVVVYYLVFTPVALVLRLIGRDLLERKPDPGKDSYWLDPEKSATTAVEYERQF